MKTTYDLYDIYIIRTYGVPIFTGCTRSDYCQHHPEQHELHAGFFSAMHSFAKNSFNENKMNSIFFDKIQVNIKTDEEQQVMIIFIHPIGVSKKIIDEYLEETATLFTTKYYPRIEEGKVQQDLFEEFKTDLKARGIIPNREMKNTFKIQKKLRDLILQQFPVLKKLY